MTAGFIRYLHQGTTDVSTYFYDIEHINNHLDSINSCDGQVSIRWQNMGKYPNLRAADLIGMDSIGKRSRSCIDGIEIAVERNEPENIEHYFTLFCETFRGKHSLREFHCRVSRYMPTQYMELMVRIFEIPEARYINLQILDGNCPLEDVPIFLSATGFDIKMQRPRLYNRYFYSGER